MGRRLAVRAALEHRHYLAVAYSQVSVDFSNSMCRTLCQSVCSLNSAQSRTALLSSHTQKDKLFVYSIDVCDADPSKFWGRSVLNYVGPLCVPNPHVALGAILLFLFFSESKQQTNTAFVTLFAVPQGPTML